MTVAITGLEDPAEGRSTNTEHYAAISVTDGMGETKQLCVPY